MAMIIEGSARYRANRATHGTALEWVVIVQELTSLDYIAVNLDPETHESAFIVENVVGDSFRVLLYKEAPAGVTPFPDGFADWENRFGTSHEFELEMPGYVEELEIEVDYYSKSVYEFEYESEGEFFTDFYLGPVDYTDYPLESGTELGPNLITVADNGHFVPYSATPENDVELNLSPESEPYPGIAPDFTYVQLDPEQGVLLDPGEYSITNTMSTVDRELIPIMWSTADRTGTEFSSMMLVNSDGEDKCFFQTTVPVTVGDEYLLTFWALNVDEEIEATLGVEIGSKVEYFDPLPYANPESDWIQYGTTYTADSGSLLIRLITATAGEFVIDNVELRELNPASVLEGPIRNMSGVDIELCGETVTVSSNETEADELDLTITKSQSCDIVVVGSVLTYCVEIANNSTLNFENLVWRDVLNARLTYVEDSFTVNEVPETPTIEGQELSWLIPQLNAGQTIEICFRAKLGPAISEP